MSFDEDQGRTPGHGKDEDGGEPLEDWIGGLQDAVREPGVPDGLPDAGSGHGYAPDLLGVKKIYRKISVDIDTPLEEFSFTENGNGDRFFSRNAGEVLLQEDGSQRLFYSVGPDGRWIANKDVGAGDVTRRCRELLEEMRARSRALADEAQAVLVHKPEDEDAITKLSVSAALLKWTTASDNLRGMSGMARSACLTYEMTTGRDGFDAQINLLATPTHVIELHRDADVKVSVRTIEPDDRITYSTGAHYRPEILDDPPELIRDYLETFMPERERQRLIFKALGSALLGTNSERLLLIFKGKTTTGKSQLVSALEKTLGDYTGAGNASIFRGTLDDKPRPDIIKLLNKRMAFLTEASKSWELHCDRVKALTGRDTLSMRQLYSGDVMDVIPQFTPILVTNEMPRINDPDAALKGRLCVIDFNRQPKTEDTGVKERFLESVEVREWLLAALVRGFEDYAREGLADVRASFIQNTEQAFGDTSHLEEFFEWLAEDNQLRELNPDEMAVHGAKSRYVTLAEMHSRYMFWIKEHGGQQDNMDKLNFKAFNKQLRTTYGWVSVTSGKDRWEGRSLSGTLSGGSLTGLK